MNKDPILRAMEAASDKCYELKMGEAFCFITDDGWEKIITAAIEAYEAAKWRPIEEAPRDGTWILIYRPNGPHVIRWIVNGPNTYDDSGWYEQNLDFWGNSFLKKENTKFCVL